MHFIFILYQFISFIYFIFYNILPIMIFLRRENKTIRNFSGLVEKSIRTIFHLGLFANRNAMPGCTEKVGPKDKTWRFREGRQTGLG